MTYLIKQQIKLKINKKDIITKFNIKGELVV